MSGRRFLLVVGHDLRDFLTRPLFLGWAPFLLFNAWLMSRGNWIVSSVDTSVGSQVSWVNSEFQLAFSLAIMTFFLFGFFVALGTGTGVIRDATYKVGDLLHPTPLRSGEYVWGKFTAALLGVLLLVAVLILGFAFFNHVLPNPENPESYGPFSLRAHLMPVVIFVLPALLLTAGATFAIGVATLRPILVFLLPIAAFLFFWEFFWDWFPPDMDPRWVSFWQMADPAGFRWLKQTWLIVDRGIPFYNTQPIRYDAGFALSRLIHCALGLALVEWSRRRFVRELRRPGTSLLQRLAPWLRRRAPRLNGAPAAGTRAGLAALGMSRRRLGGWRAALVVARFELRELRSQPALWLLVPLIFIVTWVVLTDATPGPFRTPLLLTPGAAAMLGFPLITVWTVLLILIYGVESLRREESTGVVEIYRATSVPTGAILAGKVVANAGVMLAILLAAFLATALMILGQPGVALDLTPYVLLWGPIFLPTFLVWITFVLAVYALTRSRGATYGIGLGVLFLTVWWLVEGEMTWVTNWPLASAALVQAVPWSDMGFAELDGLAVVLNRLMVVGLAGFFAVVAALAYRRRERDAVRSLRSLLAGLPRGAKLAAGACLAATLAAGFALWVAVHSGFQGDAAERRQKDYWRANLATWLDAPLPQITHVDLAIDLEPADRRFRVAGGYDLINRQEEALTWIPVTGGLFWEELSWTLDGEPFTPEDHSGLQVFKPPAPLVPGGTLRLGFHYRGTLPQGISRNGGPLPLGEFMLPSGVVVTGRNPEFVPVVGYVPARGIDEENRYEPRRYPPDFHLGPTEADLDRSLFTHRLRITAPAEYTVNATGWLVGDEVADGRRTVVWETDYPLRVFNLIAGRWDVKRGERTAVFYHPEHHYNVDSMLAALDGALRHYSEWFHPYVWRELRLSEFPALALYARGNPTNIFFSEGIGFLTGTSPRVDQAFLVTAHEAAHQWWGHIVANGAGPGGIVLAEGAAHYATMMLLEEVRGPLQRMTFARNIESFYGEYRQASGERPLAESYLHRPGDTTVVYDKGGWVFWMLMHQMGRDAFLDGVRQFFRVYHHNPDHPVIQDFVATLRPFAPDPEAFDEFVAQWFFDLVMPEYRIVERTRAEAGDGVWDVRVRVANVGTGRMPVEVAATRGERFAADGSLSPEYRDCRDVLVLGAGEEGEVRLRCSFEPQRVVVDPDLKVFQLQRQAATVRF